MVLDLSLAVVSGMGSQRTHVKLGSALHEGLPLFPQTSISSRWSTFKKKAQTSASELPELLFCSLSALNARALAPHVIYQGLPRRRRCLGFERRHDCQCNPGRGLKHRNRFPP